MSDTPTKSNYALLLNRLAEMQRVAYYATAKQELGMAEQAIVKLERELAAATERAEKAEKEVKRVCDLHKALMKNADERAESAERRADENARDAERYRWAKAVLAGDDTAEADAKTLGIAAGLIAGKDVDMAIDAARSGEGKK